MPEVCCTAEILYFNMNTGVNYLFYIEQMMELTIFCIVYIFNKKKIWKKNQLVLQISRHMFIEPNVYHSTITPNKLTKKIARWTLVQFANIDYNVCALLHLLQCIANNKFHWNRFENNLSQTYTKFKGEIIGKSKSTFLLFSSNRR